MEEAVKEELVRFVSNFFKILPSIGQKEWEEGLLLIDTSKSD